MQSILPPLRSQRNHGRGGLGLGVDLNQMRRLGALRGERGVQHKVLDQSAGAVVLLEFDCGGGGMR